MAADSTKALRDDLESLTEAVSTLAERLGAVERRAEHVETQTGIRTQAEVLVAQRIADEELLSRFPNSREEALAQQAAQDRQSSAYDVESTDSDLTGEQPPGL
jgi:hypothetical protein